MVAPRPMRAPYSFILPPSMRALAAVALFLLGTEIYTQQLSPPITSKFKCLTNGCCDQHEWCRFWASIGECSVNEDWMRANCQLACGTCTARPASPLPTTTTTKTSTAPITSPTGVTTTSIGTPSTSGQTTTTSAGSSAGTTFVTQRNRLIRIRLPDGRVRVISRPRMIFVANSNQQRRNSSERSDDGSPLRPFFSKQSMTSSTVRQMMTSRIPQSFQPVIQTSFSAPSSPSRSEMVKSSFSETSEVPPTNENRFPNQFQPESPAEEVDNVESENDREVEAPPTGAVTPVSSCKDVAANRAAEVMLASGLVDAVDDTFGRATLSIDDITRSVPTGCVPQLKSDGLDCNTNLCYHLMFRSFDGTCNNLKNPLKGAAFRPFLRHVPPQYDDGKGEPISSLNETRPSAREANRVMLSSAQSVVHDKFNSLMMQFGQFISHDIAKTTLQPSAQCQTCSPVPSKCMPIPIAPKDPNMQFKAKECLKVSRSAPICQISPREQLNENTAYIDGSMIYGSSSKDLFKFREGRTGLLRLTRFNNQMVLPFDQSKCQREDNCLASFTAGDIRANLFVGLASLHIMFAREHNRVVGKLQQLNPQWSGDRLFQEARKINGAQIQHVFFGSYLPKLLGTSMEKTMGAYNGYDDTSDSTIANEFTTGAFRFGHGMIGEFYQRIDFSGNNITHGGFFFGDGVFKSGKILFEGGIDPILRGFMITPVKRPHRMTPAITEKMFGSTDLGSLNIQRGRDHGIPSYNRMREFCGLPRAKTFEDFGDMILDKNLRFGLSKNYKTPDDVDFYVGAMLEDPVVGGLVGTTLSCVIGEQFKRTRNGDRFYYENPGVFTPSQLEQIKKISLSKIICNNGDQFELISQDAFLLPGSQLTPCSQLSEIDFAAWKE